MVGQVTQTFHFAGLADFQHVTDQQLICGLIRPWERQPRPHLTGTAAQTQPGHAAAPAASAAPSSALAPFALSIPPATFCISDLPTEFLPRRPGAAKREVAQMRAAVQPQAPAPKRRAGIGRSMQFGTPVAVDGGTVPLEPPEDVKETIRRDEPLYKAMWEHFQKRPIWMRGSLKRALGQELIKTDAHMRFRLPQLAYYFTAGPCVPLFARGCTKGWGVEWGGGELV
eukprot:scaffold4205_cov105-Isochrysis_galbana.AAC.3